MIRREGDGGREMGTKFGPIVIEIVINFEREEMSAANERVLRSLRALTIHLVHFAHVSRAACSASRFLR